MQIDDLIEWVRGLTGPDREVDALILALSEDRAVRYENGMMLAKSNRAPYDECVLGAVDAGKVQRNFSPISSSQPAFTASLDAAVALVERVLPGWDQGSSFLGEDGGYAEVWEHGYHDDTVVKSHGKTQAIALLFAILSALKAKEARSDTK